MSGPVDAQLPGEVRAELVRRADRGLVDAAQLAAVRSRFDDGQAEALARYLGTSQSANTVRAYRSDWRGWLSWCAAQERTALPADPLDLAVYLATTADLRKPDGADWLLSPSTLERKAAAIAAVHAAGGLPSPTRSDVVRLTLRGIRRARGARPNRKRPVLLHTLGEMLAQRPEDGWPGGITRRRDALILLVGFAGALRRTELATITLDDVRADTDARTGEPVLIVALATTKTDQTGVAGQQVVLPRGQRPDTCPVCAFADWTELVEINAERGAAGLRSWLTDHAEATPRRATPVHRCHGYQGTRLADGTRRPLFVSVNRHGGLGTTAITGRAIGELVKRYALRAGLDPDAFAGHSLRAGFATQAALGGASDREIMRQGRWSNAGTVHRYIRTANPLEDNAVTKLGL
ncbi:MAG TPA: site-specific integrase [Pseudonocardiaceae bacterium]|jgi:integrase|nr:site-specific integrase [Pseudonocardiaceae bacterium]